MKKTLFYLLVFLFIAVLLSINVGNVITSDKTKTSENITDTSVFDIYEDHEAKEIENSIREAEKERIEQLGGSTRKQIQETLNKLESGEISLRQIFSDTFFAGDSLMNGLEIYGILNPDCLATQVSASLSHLSENLKKIVSANPSNLILHYGINMISTQKSQLESFIYSYSGLINQLKSELPQTRIIISGIFPVDTSSATDERFKMIAEYNKALKKMCEDLGVEFMDSTKAFEGNSDYYASDGIHVSSGFYTDVWLPFIVESKGIIG